MKAKIKALKGKTVRLFWGVEGWDHNAVGVIRKLRKVQFDFKMNDEMLISVRYENIDKVIEI